jgi:hypothetical protein
MPSLTCILEGARSLDVPNPKPKSPQTTTAYLRVMSLSPKITDIARGTIVSAASTRHNCPKYLKTTRNRTAYLSSVACLATNEPHLLSVMEASDHSTDSQRFDHGMVKMLFLHAYMAMKAINTYPSRSFFIFSYSSFAIYPLA